MKKSFNRCVSCDGLQQDDKYTSIRTEEYRQLIRVDARMDALISYIETRKKDESWIEKDDIKAIIGMCDE